MGGNCAGRASRRSVSRIVDRNVPLRELSGLLECSRHSDVKEWIRRKVVRWNLDSKPSVANLMNGGGPVMALCAVVKQLWIEWDALGITSTFRWLSRETMEMKRVDEASKALSFWLKEEIRTELSLKFGREFFSERGRVYTSEKEEMRLGGAKVGGKVLVASAGQIFFCDHSYRTALYNVCVFCSSQTC